MAAMEWFQKHLRNTLLAGALAAAPLAVTVFVVWYIETKTRISPTKCSAAACRSSAW
jgi:uncharacterized membrane protein